MSLPAEAPADAQRLLTQTLGHALAWCHAGRRVATATVIETWGSSPCPAGSLLVVDDDGNFEGSVSGGCVEGEVIESARAVLGGAKPQILEFGIADADAWAVGLACGGRVRIHVAALDEARRAAFEEISRRLARRQASLLVTRLDDASAQRFDAGELPPQPELANAAREAWASDRCIAVATEDTNSSSVLCQPFNPSPRLAIVGAVHIAQHLALTATRLGYAVRVIDPRTAFATAERFPGVAISHAWPAEALAEFGIDARTAVVALTHDPKLDDPALTSALASEAFYIGALGSRKNHARRCARLVEAGASPAAVERIHGPVGLDIGARNPGEIALSIAAQMTAALRKPTP